MTTTPDGERPEPDEDAGDAEAVANAELPLDPAGPTELGAAVDE